MFHPGALFFTGDAHAAQGDGEISGTAIETANTAMQMAADQTIEWLAELEGFDPFTTIPLASVCIDYRITQIVDGTKGVHAMIPKKYFVDRRDEYWYRP